MRVNLPITQREFPFPDGATLVSTTDLQGRILYCNQTFIEVSGYAKEELLGQPHNLVRHPDMPAEAFRDMWATLQGGQPWTAMVKNRRKNGDHYWVLANVTPLADAGGRPTGFMSVRTQPTRAQIEAADALYKQMMEDAKSSSPRMALHRSRPVKNTPMARLVRSLTPGLKARMSMIVGVVGLAAMLGGAALSGGLGGLAALGVGGLLGGVLAVLALALLAGQALQALTVNPLLELVGYANRMAGGDLSLRFDSQRQDEVGDLTRALAQLNVNLMSIVRDARNGVVQMRQDTRVIAEGNQDLSGRTESQASSLEETASSMEQITATIRQSTDMAAQATEHADSARGVTERSSAAVQALAGTMHSISEASRKISEIIQVVDSIAFQTNILALNAAVEAARAGEQGRGFAVVAGEVRALAGRTTVAAREIRGLIQASVEQVAEGSQQTDSARAAMDEARGAVDEVHRFIQQISQGMKEQMLGVTQINQAVAEMDNMTQQNAALVEEIAASATTLRDQAGEVADSVSVFRLQGAGQPQPDAVSLRKAAKAASASAAPSAPAAAPSRTVVNAGSGHASGSGRPAASRRPAAAAPRPAPAPARPAPARPKAPSPAATAGGEAQGDGGWDEF
jgi:aerotaxis receptor